MPPTPNLPDLAGGYSLRPVSKAILPMVIEAYIEDPESARAALPWLKNDEDITRQLADMLHDLEHLSNADRVHFWSIHDEENTFIGLIGFEMRCNWFIRITISAIGSARASETVVLHRMQLILFSIGLIQEVQLFESRSQFIRNEAGLQLLNGFVRDGTAR